MRKCCLGSGELTAACSYCMCAIIACALRVCVVSHAIWTWVSTVVHPWGFIMAVWSSGICLPWRLSPEWPARPCCARPGAVCCISTPRSRLVANALLPCLSCLLPCRSEIVKVDTYLALERAVVSQETCHGGPQGLDLGRRRRSWIVLWDGSACPGCVECEFTSGQRPIC